MRSARAGPRPHKGGKGGDKQLDDHARGADQHPLPPVAEAPGGAGIHVGYGRENHQHHAHHMHLAAVALAEGRVAKLMQRFDEHQAEVKQREVVGRKRRLALHLQVVHMLEGDVEGCAHHCQPEQHARGADEPADIGQREVEQRVWIEQREPREHDVQQARLSFPLAGLFKALEQLRRVSGLIVKEEVCLVELAQQLDHRLLSGSRVRKLLDAFLPDLLDRAVRPKPANERPRLRAQPEELLVERVLQYDPALAAENLPPGIDTLAQGDLLVRDAIPGLAEGGLRFGHGQRLRNQGVN